MAATQGYDSIDPKYLHSAARIRAGTAIVKQIAHERASFVDDWEGERLTVNFHSKEGPKP